MAKVQLSIKYDHDTAQRLLKNPIHFPEFCERCLMIQDVGGGLVPFKLNRIQMWFFFSFILPDYLAGKPIRVMILKCRQTGMSTLISGWTLWCTLGHKSWTSALIAKKKDQTKDIFTMTKRFVQNLPEGTLLPNFIRKQGNIHEWEWNQPDEHRWFKKMRLLDNKVFLDSRIRILSGEDRDELGRSGTYHTIHGSECAFWKYLDEALNSLFSAVHPRPETSIFLETTANGYNSFYEAWTNKQVKKKHVPSFWKTCFIPWYWDDKYEYDDGEIDREFVDPYEEDLFRRILTDHTLEEVGEDRAWAKIFWRRMAIEERKGDVDKFMQEYPATDTEAFISSGRPVFAAQHMKRLDLSVREPEWKGTIVFGEEGELVYKEDSWGELSIWEEPKPDEYYVIAGDLSEGKLKNTIEGTKHDYSVWQILKCTPFPPVEQVAIWHGYLEPDVFFDIGVQLARKYNDALLSWECNTIGTGGNYHVCVKNRYWKVYRRTIWDAGHQEKSKVVGWYTSGPTKHSMVIMSQEVVREGYIVVHDSGTISEMRAYSEEDGKYQPTSGHDDRVMALCQGIAVARPMLQTFEIQKESDDRRKKQKAMSNPYLERLKGNGWNPYLGNEF